MLEVVVGMMAFAIFGLIILLDRSVNRLAKMNEKLMVMATSRDGDAVGARLLSTNRPPQGPIPGVAKSAKEKPTTGTIVTYGAEM